MLRKNYLKDKLEKGGPVLGTWSMIPSTVTADIIASTGLDFMIIDAEHGPVSFETAQAMVMVCESRGVSPVMRVGSINESDILRALDIGVHCIQVPNIETKQDVLDLVELATYPPIGKRGFSPFTRAGNYSIENSTILTGQANENIMIAVNIEGKNAIENIDEILKIKELDIIFIGLYDLSKALGMPGEVDHPKILDYLAELTQKINLAGKFPGTIATSERNMEKFISIGLKYIVYLVDCEMLRMSYQKIRNSFEEIKNVKNIHY